jgi:pimeloyl-ACP methyl ester carboxylesterase
MSRLRRTIVVDRPGYGYSDRPRSSAWTPEEQAALFVGVMDELGLARATVFGHSWGTLPAIAMALDHADRVAGLVLASGYYYPEPRSDTVLLSPPAIPVLGDVMRHTISPLLLRAMAPGAIARMFAPRPVSPAFEQFFPLGLTMRPSQIRASAEEVAMMNASAARLQQRYRDIACPVALIAGDGDEIVETQRHTARLHGDISHSSLTVIQGTGHMLHHAEPHRIAGIIAGLAQTA